MKIIKGINRHQMQFSSLDDQLTGDNPVRIIDAFVEKLDKKTEHSSHDDQPCLPAGRKD